MCFKTDLAKYQPNITAFVSSRIANEADARDVIQEVNRVVVEKQDEVDEDKPFFSWIMVITRYQIKAYFKAKQRTPDLISLDDEAEDAEECVFWGRPSSEFLGDIPFQELVEPEIKALQAKIEALLSPTQLKIFRLICQGFSMKEISRELNMKYSAVSLNKRRLIARAQNYLLTFYQTNKYDYRSH